MGGLIELPLGGSGLLNIAGSFHGLTSRIRHVAHALCLSLSLLLQLSPSSLLPLLARLLTWPEK